MAACTESHLAVWPLSMQQIAPIQKAARKDIRTSGHQESAIGHRPQLECNERCSRNFPTRVGEKESQRAFPKRNRIEAETETETEMETETETDAQVLAFKADVTLATHIC